MVSISAFVLFAALSSGAAQQPASPSLQARPANPSEERPTVVVRNHATSVLPDDGSGLYRFEDSGAGKGSNFGEGVELDEQFGDVTGYLTVKAQGGKVPLQAYFLNHIEGGGGDLSFTTKAVHGLSYSFEGKLVRGQGLTRAQDGFYVMQGELITHDESGQTQRRTISLKLTALH